MQQDGQSPREPMYGQDRQGEQLAGVSVELYFTVVSASNQQVILPGVGAPDTEHMRGGECRHSTTKIKHLNTIITKQYYIRTHFALPDSDVVNPENLHNILRSVVSN